MFLVRFYASLSTTNEKLYPCYIVGSFSSNQPSLSLNIFFLRIKEKSNKFITVSNHLFSHPSFCFRVSHHLMGCGC